MQYLSYYKHNNVSDCYLFKKDKSLKKNFLFVCLFFLLFFIPDGEARGRFNPSLKDEIQMHKQSKKVAILYISTGRYIVFWEPFYQATEKYFLPGIEKKYFLFTDHKHLSLPKNVTSVYIPQEPWPNITLKRYHFFLSQRSKLKEFDYLFFMNGNLIFQNPIGLEVLPSEEQKIMVTQHPSFWKEKIKERLTYDRNPKSKSYVGWDEGGQYFMGGFNGGISSDFLAMSQTIKDWTDVDISNGVMPLWHDESMLNRYMINFMKETHPLILEPNYAVPEGEEKRYPEPIKGILLDKRKMGGHSYLRQ